MTTALKHIEGAIDEVQLILERVFNGNSIQVKRLCVTRELPGLTRGEISCELSTGAEILVTVKDGTIVQNEVLAAAGIAVTSISQNPYLAPLVELSADLR